MKGLKKQTFLRERIKGLEADIVQLAEVNKTIFEQRDRARDRLDDVSTILLETQGLIKEAAEVAGITTEGMDYTQMAILVKRHVEETKEEVEILRERFLGLGKENVDLLAENKEFCRLIDEITEVMGTRDGIAIKHINKATLIKGRAETNNAEIERLLRANMGLVGEIEALKEEASSCVSKPEFEAGDMVRFDAESDDRTAEGTGRIRGMCTDAHGRYCINDLAGIVNETHPCVVHVWREPEFITKVEPEPAYCDACVFLDPKEAKANHAFEGHKCLHRDYYLFHGGQHPRIPRPDRCDGPYSRIEEAR